MQVSEAVVLALKAAWSHKLRSFFTLLGIIVSVAFSSRSSRSFRG